MTTTRIVDFLIVMESWSASREEPLKIGNGREYRPSEAA
jgi:hypothetical protein